MFKSKDQAEAISIPSLPKVKVSIPNYMLIANGELGQAEYAGAEDNPRIAEYFTATTYPATDDETPWCSAFVNWVMKSAGVARTKSAAAISWLDWGVVVKPSKVRYGDVLIWDYKNGKGHVAFFVGVDATTGDILALGGNQSNSVNVGRFAKNSVAAIRRPKTPVQSTTVWNGISAATMLGATAASASNAVTQAKAAIAAKTVAAKACVEPARGLLSNAEEASVVGYTNPDVLISPELGDTIAGVLPAEWAIYVPIGIAVLNVAYIVYERLRRLNIVNF